MFARGWLLKAVLRAGFCQICFGFGRYRCVRTTLWLFLGRCSLNFCFKLRCCQAVGLLRLRLMIWLNTSKNGRVGFGKYRCWVSWSLGGPRWQWYRFIWAGTIWGVLSGLRLAFCDILSSDDSRSDWRHRLFSFLINVNNQHISNLSNYCPAKNFLKEKTALWTISDQNV